MNFDNLKGKRVAVAMSGGVDSSTVAYLLKKNGIDIFGITMKTFADEDSDAKKVCDDLGIEHYLLDVTEEFKKEVIDYFVKEYNSGKTPNPCVVCNRKIKFGKLLEFAKKNGADFLATGHYANIENGKLAIGEDPKKDQAYFLSQILKENLNYILFPLGNTEKEKVRELAKDLGVRVHNKKDSQEICFVEDGKLKEFLVKETAGKISKVGDIVDTNGNVLGKHEGLAFYTIGQRKGLGISSTAPLYVIELDNENNRVIVGSNEKLFKKSLVAVNINIYNGDSIYDLNGIECMVKTRSRDKFHRCTINVLDKEKIEVKFLDEEVRAVTPGQAAVFYNEKGEIIASSFILN